jgi:hypothetical protein
MSSSTSKPDQAAVKNYNVTYFAAVVVTSTAPLDGFCVAPLVSTYKQARDLLTPYIKQYPDSKIQEITTFYVAEDDLDRLALLASLNTVKSQA